MGGNTGSLRRYLGTRVTHDIPKGALSRLSMVCSVRRDSSGSRVNEVPTPAAPLVPQDLDVLRGARRRFMYAEDELHHLQHDGMRATAYLLRILGLGITAAAVILARVSIMGGTPRFTSHNNPAAFVEAFGARAMSYWHYYAVNAWLLALPLPWHLSCDWSMGAVPLVETPSDPRNLASALLLLLLLASAAYILSQARLGFPSVAGRHFSASFILLCVPFIPASNLFFTVGFAVAERVLYLPSLGFCIALACAWDSWAPRSPPLSLGLLGAAVGAYGWGTMTRNGDWSTSKRLFASSIRATPLNAKLYHNLAHVSCGVEKSQGGLVPAGQAKNCSRLYEKAIQLAPDFADAYGGYGVLIQDENVASAVQLLEQAVVLDPQNKVSITFPLPCTASCST